MDININKMRPMRKLGQYIKDFFNDKVAIMRFKTKAQSMDEKMK